ncbi:MAG: PTS sugar transporter subunit IIA [Phycisphaerales bacterium]|jgi:nitrogen PTS system EIIA component|nr:PTS sugar transporter subunit IIA [Phycisphaerales bacterium]MBT7171324.1 PTS sugar transporter subunit IIA [Phycisphaerales bacterium]
MKLSEIMITKALVPEVQATKRDDVIKELVAAMVDAGAISQDETAAVIKAIIAREKQATTGIGKGIALPHAKLASIKKPIATIGLVADGVDFSSLDTQPVFGVILLLSNPDTPDEHLQAMETIFKNVQREMFRKFLFQAKDVDSIVELLRESDDMN